MLGDDVSLTPQQELQFCSPVHPVLSCPCPVQAGLPSPDLHGPQGECCRVCLCHSWAPLPLLQVACLCAGQAKDFHRAASTSRHLHVVPKEGHCGDLLFTFLFNKLSPIIALALELKASGVMNNCYF